MKTWILIGVGLLSWAAGLWHVQVLAEAAAAADAQSSLLTSNNIPYLVYTAMLFVMPVVGWALRNRAPFWAALLIAAFPVLLMAATLRVTVS
jgi:hypothetical protein